MRGLFCGEDEGVGAGGDVDVVAKGEDTECLIQVMRRECSRKRLVGDSGVGDS